MVSIVATSIGGWDRYIEPMIVSIRANEGDNVKIIVVSDVGVKGFMGAEIIQPQMKFNCSQGQNVGIERADINDWIVVCDVDVLCQGKFVDDLLREPTDCVLGKKFHQQGSYGAKHSWIDGWIYAFPPGFFEKVGLFDVNFRGSGFEDADICWRAVDAGYRLKWFHFPFEHLEAGIKREITPEYEKVRHENIMYLQRKWGLN